MIKTEFEEPILITVTNQKGGVGKTTITINLAEQLARQGYRTLIIDTDPQGNVSDRLLIDEIQKTLADVLSEEISAPDAICSTNYAHLQVIPSGKEKLAEVISKFDRRCTGLRQCSHTFRKIKDTSDGFDFVLVDTPPHSRSLLLRAAYGVSDFTLLVIEPEVSSLLGILQNHTLFAEEQKYNPKLKLLGTVLNMVDNTVCSGIIQKQVKQLKSNILPFKTNIRRRTKIREAQMAKECIANYAKAHSRDFERLCDEVLERIAAQYSTKRTNHVVSLPKRALL